jgi:hypothetical protein
MSALLPQDKIGIGCRRPQDKIGVACGPPQDNLTECPAAAFDPQ